MRAPVTLLSACLLALALAASAATAAPRTDALAALERTPAQLETVAARGHSHALYARSPGGAAATAERVARYRPLIERAVAGSGFGADMLEAIVFLESAGRPDAVAGGGDVAAASGLTQILAETGTSFLGMRIQLAKSRALSKQIATARAKGQHAKARRLEAQRRQVDPRFDPAQALAASVRYLTSARDYLHRNDLAVASYHMGIGNLQNVIRRHVGAPADARTAALVQQHELSYARLYFGSAPDERPAAWRLLSSLNDDSLNYYWKVLAARQIMHLYRSDRAALAHLSALHGRKASAEEVLHPRASTRHFATPADVAAARADGHLLALAPVLAAEPSLRLNPSMGELAPRLGRRPALYRALRPGAMATLVYIGRRVQELSGAQQPLVVTSTVRDGRYQRLLLKRNSQATHGYSLHTTGYAFDLARIYETPEQGAAVQFVLDRLQAHGLLTWVKEPAALHVTVARDAAALVPHVLGPPPAAPEEPAPPAQEPQPEPEPEPAQEPAARESAHVRTFGPAEAGLVAPVAQPPRAEVAPNPWTNTVRRIQSLLSDTP